MSRDETPTCVRCGRLEGHALHGCHNIPGYHVYRAPTLPPAADGGGGPQQDEGHEGKTENGQPQAPGPSRDATMRDAADIVNAITRPVHVAGYLVALYGSVLARGVGRDIDLLLVPWRDGASSAIAISGIIATLGGVEVGERYHGAMGTIATTVFARGRILDIQVREVATDSLAGASVPAFDRSRSYPENALAPTAPSVRPVEGEDAARYRFLRDNPLQLRAIDGNAGWCGQIVASAFDYSVDAARAPLSAHPTPETEQ